MQQAEAGRGIDGDAYPEELALAHLGPAANPLAGSSTDLRLLSRPRAAVTISRTDMPDQPTDGSDRTEREARDDDGEHSEATASTTPEEAARYDLLRRLNLQRA